jgi:hypothetical protein
MSPTKVANYKKQKNTRHSNVSVDETPNHAPPKKAKSLEIDDLDHIASTTISIEEKLPEDPIATENEDTDLELEELELDDEELNPFGDKWEQ